MTAGQPGTDVAVPPFPEPPGDGGAGAGDGAGGSGRGGAFGRWWRGGNRTLPVLGAVAVVSLAAGLGLSRLIINPADAAARTAPPPAGPITVPVESRELSNDVTIRGDVVFDDAADVRVETSDLGERAVVTGQVPEVGATFDAGSVALEIAGRPVIVLPGGLPTYRTLRVGVSGPDVVQLKQALGQLGIDAGDPASDAYDAATARGVEALYQRAGYAAPAPSDEEAEALSAAEQGVRSAQAEVTAAETALATAGRGGSAAGDVAQADADVRQAERARDVARATLADREAACGAPTPSPEVDCSSAGLLQARNAVADAEDAVGVAAARRAQLDAAPDTSGEQASLTSARQSLTDAQKALTEAQEAVITVLPASEVVYLETLPRRVDAVSVQRGGTVDGTVMSVSGAKLEVVASAAKADAALLEVGATGTVVAGDLEVPVTVTELRTDDSSGGSGGSGDDQGGEDGSGSGSGAGRTTVVLTPDDLTPEQVAELQGSNVRVTIPVSSTGGAVLAVPLAALTAGPGGESRVELMGDDDATELVEVETGLAAGGYVEVTGVDRDLAEGDLVVIGSSGEQDDPTADPTAGSDG